MKIAIDITYNPYGGTKTQIVNMLSYFSKINDIDIIIYLTKINVEMTEKIDQSNVSLKISKIAGLSLAFRLLWQQLLLPLYLIINKVDVLFCPGNISPIIFPIKRVQWIGTIGPFFPEFYKHFNLSNKLKLYLNKLFMVTSAYFANAVIFESEFTKKLFISKYKTRLLRSHVINIGNDIYYHKIENDDYLDLHNKYGKFIPFALCVSHLYPYKNIIRMLKAFKNSIEDTDVEMNLLIAGSRDYDYYDKKILSHIKKLCLQQNVILLGAVSKETLRYLYSNCELMIFPSPFENFAYTLVEAMGCGSPIVCSNTTAMPETCGNAALYFDPYDIEEMTEKISLLLLDKKLRNSYRQKSIARVNELPNYKEVTMQTLNIMNNLVNKGLE